MRYDDYLQALAQGLVDELGVHVTIKTQFYKFNIRSHDHTPPNGRTLITIDYAVTIDVSYKFMSSWKLEVPAWFRTITFAGDKTSGTGQFIQARVNTWIAAQRIYQNLMTMDNLTMIQPVVVNEAAESFNRGWHEVMTGDVSPVQTLWEGIEDELETRDFHIGDILTITTGRLVTKDGTIDPVMHLLNFMTTDQLFTHQLPRAMDECGPYLLKQHPQLRDVQTTNDDWQAWLNEQAARYGEYLPVTQIPRDKHQKRDAYTELVEILGKDRVVKVQVGK